MPAAEPFALSRRFLRRERRLLRDPFGTLRRETRRRVSSWRHALRRVAVILLLLVSLGAVTFHLLPAETRAAMWNWITEWGEKFAFFRYEADGGEGEPTEMTYWRPTYIPEGFEEVEYVEQGKQIAIIYKDVEGDIIKFLYLPLEGEMDSVVDNEHQLYSTVMINGNIGHLMVSTNNNFSSYLLWTDEIAKIRFKISVDFLIDLEELIKIAENVKINKNY